jgi:glycerophosphoryl diester phosphodiesterase
MNEKKLLIAHRGASRQAPENTLKSFEIAIKLGADYIEFDVRKSKDNELVILHDPGIFRVSHKFGLIKKLDIEKIKSLDVGYGQKIPTLEELLSTTKGKINYMCEVKVRNISKEVCRLLNDYNALNSTILISFKHGELLKCWSKFPHVRMGAIVPSGLGWMLNWFFKKRLILTICKKGFYSINPFHILVNKKFVDFAHDQGLKVFPWTVNSAKRIKKLIKMGVDGILTNDLESFKQSF